MFVSMAVLAIALQGTPSLAPQSPTPLLHHIRHRRHGHPPPCGDGYDLDERDGMCYRNGEVPPQFQSGRYYPLKYGGGRQPVQCGTGADLDSRDGFCYQTDTVPRRFQAARQRHRDK